MLALIRQALLRPHDVVRAPCHAMRQNTIGTCVCLCVCVCARTPAAKDSSTRAPSLATVSTTFRSPSRCRAGLRVIVIVMMRTPNAPQCGLGELPQHTVSSPPPVSVSLRQRWEPGSRQECSLPTVTPEHRFRRAIASCRRPHRPPGVFENSPTHAPRHLCDRPRPAS